jgi:dihydrodipicolinate synthase/N-acetylneuraminate lyase
MRKRAKALYLRPGRPGYHVQGGLSIPSLTILDERNRVIEGQQRALFRYLVQSGFGADIIFAAGTTGEWSRIPTTEQRRLIEITADQIRIINCELEEAGHLPVEAWAGVTAPTKRETLTNLECALEAGADAAVVAPLSIGDLDDVVSFFQRDVNDLFDHKGRWLPMFLYDNADIAADPRAQHIRTRDVKRLSRLPFIFGLKVSASRRVLGNYTKAALHFKDKGVFGIYVGNAMLIFEVFHMRGGLLGRIREYWDRYLLHDELPVGVVSGPANIWPREWQRAWRACFAGDERLMPAYKTAFEQFERACHFTSGSKMIACLKYALKLEGVIDSDLVAQGTAALKEGERRRFKAEYFRIKRLLEEQTDPIWISRHCYG